MRIWNIELKPPLTLPIAADARLVATDYVDDQIWELTAGSGDPPALVLATTYGLRANSMRLFPRFGWGNQTFQDIATYTHPPLLLRLLPNYLSLSLEPFQNLNVFAEYWVPGSHSIAGRFQLTNQGDKSLSINLELISILIPSDGQRMASTEIQGVTVLSGKASNMSPLIFVSGGAVEGQGSFPSLVRSYQINPGEMQEFVWVHAALPDPNESFDHARNIATRNFEAEIAKVEIINEGQLDIYTGEVEWDLALALSQRWARSLFVGPAGDLPYPTVVLNRNPDLGYSSRGDGSDYSHLWNGQSTHEVYYLAELLLPSDAPLLAGLLRNYLATQRDDGFIDWKPGARQGQRSNLLAPPILANLTWRIYSYSNDRQLLTDTFDGLLRFFWLWLSDQHDEDEDGIPELDRSVQAGLDDHPIYSNWEDAYQGVNIKYAELPAILSFLYVECMALINIAETIQRKEPLDDLIDIMNKLVDRMSTFWSQRDGFYFDQDRNSHRSPNKQNVGQIRGQGVLEINRKFKNPERLLIQVTTLDDSTRFPKVIVNGTGVDEQFESEELTGLDFRWHLGRGIVTSQNIYQGISTIEVLDVSPQDQVKISTINFRVRTILGLLPLWAEFPNQKQVRRMVDEVIMDSNQCWLPHGIPSSFSPNKYPENTMAVGVDMIQNTYILRGLLKYGYQELARDVLTILISNMVRSLKEFGRLHRYTHPISGLGFGDRNSLGGLAPVNLFLDILGIRIHSPYRVELWGLNPFPRPITIKYRGLSILRQRSKTTIIFPDGQTSVIEDTSPQVIALEIE